ncbi:MAG: histidine kinase, partial [Firmicutes bacterium]|nr:histidine kinase [Bacillota bacterium]
MESGRIQYRWLKLLTIIGPTLFVAIGEAVRYFYLRKLFPPAQVSIISVGLTAIAAIIFSFFVFAIIERVERQNQQYRSAMLALEERERLAREMHDGIVQNLAAINIKVHLAKKMVQLEQLEELNQELEDIQNTVDLSYADLRQSLYDLHASKRLEGGFWLALRRQAHDFMQTTGIILTVNPLPNDEVLWSEMASVQILRIIQESLANIRKHAQAHHVTITATKQDKEIAVCIHDDGVGFPVAILGKNGESNGHHFGLGIM